MTTAPAAEAFIDRVDPYCVISMCDEAAARASSVSPGPSWPKRNTQRSGRSASSTGWASPTLSTAMIGIARSSIHDRKDATSGWWITCW
jgi:hypothetical protein